MSNLDNRISNADQLLTNDIDKFCESVTDFYSNASKPVLDIIIYMYRLTTNIGAKVTELTIYYEYYITSMMINAIQIIDLNLTNFLFYS